MRFYDITFFGSNHTEMDEHAPTSQRFEATVDKSQIWPITLRLVSGEGTINFFFVNIMQLEELQESLDAAVKLVRERI